MRLFHQAVIAGYILFLTVGCEPKMEEKVVGRYPSGLASKIEYYQSTDSGKVLVKEVRYYSNGEKDSEGGIRNFKKDGLWKQWYNNGNLWIEENYSEGIKHGEFSVYYPTGEENYTGAYEYGAPSGIWKFYNEEGEILKEVKY